MRNIFPRMRAFLKQMTILAGGFRLFILALTMVVVAMRDLLSALRAMLGAF